MQESRDVFSNNGAFLGELQAPEEPFLVNVVVPLIQHRVSCDANLLGASSVSQKIGVMMAENANDSGDLRIVGGRSGILSAPRPNARPA